MIVFLLAATLAGCGRAGANGGGGPTAVGSSPSASIDPTANWNAFQTARGAFSLKYKPGWGLLDCTNQAPDRDNFVVINTQGVVPSKCPVEGFNEVQVTAYKRDISGYSDPWTTNFKQTSSAALTVDNVMGTRRTGTGLGSGLAPSRGTTAIEYRFASNGLIYVVLYIRNPGAPDSSGDIDLMVTDTLKFTT